MRNIVLLLKKLNDRKYIVQWGMQEDKYPNSLRTVHNFDTQNTLEWQEENYIKSDRFKLQGFILGFYDTLMYTDSDVENEFFIVQPLDTNILEFEVIVDEEEFFAYEDGVGGISFLLRGGYSIGMKRPYMLEEIIGIEDDIMSDEDKLNLWKKDIKQLINIYLYASTYEGGEE